MRLRVKSCRQGALLAELPALDCSSTSQRPAPERLQEAGHPSISFICEKLTYVGVTRFEDDTRLPLGLSVNSASYAAKTLTQARFG